MAELFGFRITRADKGSGDGFTAPPSDDGTLDVISGGGHYASILDLDGRDRNELDLIRRYRDIAQQPECDSAIEDIANEAIVSDERDKAVSLSLDRLDLSRNIKAKIREEFDEVFIHDLITESFVERSYVRDERGGKKHITMNHFHILSQLHNGITPTTLFRSEGRD